MSTLNHDDYLLTIQIRMISLINRPQHRRGTIMGRIVTPKYRIEMNEVTYPVAVGHLAVVSTNKSPWRGNYGRPTAKNIEKYVAAYINSCMPDGVNAHVGRAIGHLPVVRSACIVNQLTGDVVATWIMPTFMVF